MVFWGLVDNGKKVEVVEGACGLLKGLKLTALQRMRSQIVTGPSKKGISHVEVYELTFILKSQFVISRWQMTFLAHR